MQSKAPKKLRVQSKRSYTPPSRYSKHELEFDLLSSYLQHTYAITLSLCECHLLMFKHKSRFSNICSYMNIGQETVLSHCAMIDVGTTP